MPGLGSGAGQARAFATASATSAAAESCSSWRFRLKAALGLFVPESPACPATASPGGWLRARVLSFRVSHGAASHDVPRLGEGGSAPKL